MASPLPKSFTVSVFPVPAGPAGDPPNVRFKAYVRVIYQRSVKGVVTNLPQFPTY